jgi:hypothetical protein
MTQSNDEFPSIFSFITLQLRYQLCCSEWQSKCNIIIFIIAVSDYISPRSQSTYPCISFSLRDSRVYSLKNSFFSHTQKCEAINSPISITIKVKNLYLILTQYSHLLEEKSVSSAVSSLINRLPT